MFMAHAFPFLAQRRARAWFCSLEDAHGALHMGQFLLHLLLMNCSAHSLCMRFPQHVNRTQDPRPNCGSASRQIAQISPSFFVSSSSTARAGAAALFASPSDIKLAVFSFVVGVRSVWL